MQDWNSDQYMHAMSLQLFWLFVAPWTITHQSPLFLAFSRQEYWSGLPFRSPGDLPNPGIEPGCPALQADALSSEPPHWKRPWCWERLGTGEKGGNQWWDCWMASPTQWTWIWANSGMQWRTGKPEVHGITKSQAPLSNWTTTDCGTFFMTALRN